MGLDARLYHLVFRTCFSRLCTGLPNYVQFTFMVPLAIEAPEQVRS